MRYVVTIFIVHSFIKKLKLFIYCASATFEVIVHDVGRWRNEDTIFELGTKLRNTLKRYNHPKIQYKLILALCTLYTLIWYQCVSSTLHYITAIVLVIQTHLT